MSTIKFNPAHVSMFIVKNFSSPEGNFSLV